MLQPEPSKLTPAPLRPVRNVREFHLLNMDLSLWNSAAPLTGIRSLTLNNGLIDNISCLRNIALMEIWNLQMADFDFAEFTVLKSLILHFCYQFKGLLTELPK
jgi:hypothetical protein